MSDKNYEELLARARSQLPEEVFKKTKFELPQPRSSIVGNRTILHNFKDICAKLDRNQQHVLKFLSKEMATASTVKGGRAVFRGRFNYYTIRALIERYAKEFVICPVCHAANSRIVKKNRFHFMICDVCGAKTSIRSI